MSIDVSGILADIKDNTAKLESCDRHLFSNGKVTLGAKNYCDKCGGRLDNVAVLYYIAGYEAAGGNADDIWPGWRSKG